MEQSIKYWENALKLIEQEMSPVAFQTWIQPLSLCEAEDNILTLKTPNAFGKDMVEQRYIDLIRNSLREITNRDFLIKIILDSDVKTLEKKPAKTGSSLSENLNPRYVFNSFVVGSSNRLAHAASLAVAESPANYKNPLFLYGGTGLGKTHLMQSIAHYILENNPSMKVLYISSETFTNDLIAAIGAKKNAEFRDKYRTIDVLLVDDIQFISDKMGTQEEFFHTFNTLYNSNKQIIISSDRPPKEISHLEERLKSRFESGLIADIQPPDYETRVAILYKKAESEKLVVPDDVMSFIAKSIVSNIRELEGALNRVAAYAALTNKELNIDLAQNALENVFKERKKKVTIDSIQDVVAGHYNIRVEDLRSTKKPKNIAFPRQIAMYLSRKMLDCTLTEIGEQFGRRDHTTVLYASSKIGTEMEKDPNLRNVILELEKKIKG